MEGLVVVVGIIASMIGAIVFAFKKYPMPDPKTDGKTEYIVQRFTSKWVRMGVYKSFGVASIHAEDLKFMNPDFKYRIVTVVGGKRVKVDWI